MAIGVGVRCRNGSIGASSSIVWLRPCGVTKSLSAWRARRLLRNLTSCIRSGFFVAGILLADGEIGAAPLHLAIVGRKIDPAARALFAAALKQPVAYKRVEWWDKDEGALPNPDVQYPQLEQAAAFLCTDRSCSAPIFLPDKISSLVCCPPER